MGRLSEGKASSCLGKHQYLTQGLARKVAKKSKHGLEAYKCYYCGHYHIGARHKRSSK